MFMRLCAILPVSIAVLFATLAEAQTPTPNECWHGSMFVSGQETPVATGSVPKWEVGQLVTVFPGTESFAAAWKKGRWPTYDTSSPIVLLLTQIIAPLNGGDVHEGILARYHAKDGTVPDPLLLMQKWQPLLAHGITDPEWLKSTAKSNWEWHDTFCKGIP